MLVNRSARRLLQQLVRLHGDAQRVMQSVWKDAYAMPLQRLPIAALKGRGPSLQIAAIHFIGTVACENQLVRKF
jgi:hypothetical protein